MSLRNCNHFLLKICFSLILLLVFSSIYAQEAQGGSSQEVPLDFQESNSNSLHAESTAHLVPDTLENHLGYTEPVASEPSEADLTQETQNQDEFKSFSTQNEIFADSANFNEESSPKPSDTIPENNLNTESIENKLTSIVEDENTSPKYSDTQNSKRSSNDPSNPMRAPISSDSDINTPSKPIEVEKDLSSMIDVKPAPIEEPKPSIIKNTLAQPIQLIYPSDNHELLIVNDSSLQLLGSIDKPIAVVAVLGPLHSGKSFLMNQLLNRTSGFALGPTTEPKTRGLWMWNTPVDYGNYSIIFLDSEGLFASNISETYDAKIFAISSLMSSYLIYNSVKFIDQSAIDYIELLARRAQLFGVKAELTNPDSDEYKEEILLSTRTDKNNQSTTNSFADFVSLPRLLWVVQDFVQEMTDNETPQEWLQRLLAARKKSETSASSLPSLFDQIDCYTLFLPQYTRQKLRYLDTIQNDELLPEYIEDMKKLRSKVLNESTIKMRGKSPLNGAGTAALLRTLVMAANRGAFPEVPSIWSSFLQIQIQNALKDSINFYEQKIEAQCEHHGPLSKSELTSTHLKTIAETKSLFSKLTFGFEDVEKENTENLIAQILKIYASFESSNAHNLTRKCQESYKALRNSYKIKLANFELPIRRRVLSSQAKGLLAQHVQTYQTSLSRYVQEEAFISYLDELRSNMKGDLSNIELENSKLLELVVVNSSASAVVNCSQTLASFDKEEHGVGSEILKQHQDEAHSKAMQYFDEAASFALEDSPTATASRKALELELSKELKRYEDLNTERVRRRTLKISTGLSKQLSSEMDEIRLPQTRQIIEHKVSLIVSKYISKYESTVSDVIGMYPAIQSQKKITEAAERELAELLRRNDVKYDAIISDSLPTLKSNIMPLLQSFWWPPHAIEFARTAAKESLSGVEMIENQEMIDDLANRFVEANLSEDIASLWKKLIIASICTIVLMGLGIFVLLRRLK